MTGKFPYRLGLSHGFIAAGAPYGLPLSERTIAQEMTDHGWSSHMVGKCAPRPAPSPSARRPSYVPGPARAPRPTLPTSSPPPRADPKLEPETPPPGCAQGTWA